MSNLLQEFPAFLDGIFSVITDFMIDGIGQIITLTFLVILIFSIIIKLVRR